MSGCIERVASHGIFSANRVAPEVLHVGYTRKRAHMSVVRLIESVQFPEIFMVTRAFADDAVRDVSAAVAAALDASNLAPRLPESGEIALAVGSRGIHSLPEIVATAASWFRAKGCKPFIVPSMGSHGGATAEGQVKVLAELGITEERMGCPVRSSMETIELGVLGNGLPVHIDAMAAKADGIFVINRVKPHTAFSGRHESGLLKMLAIGLGKQKGAEGCHRLGYEHFDSVMPRMAEVIFEKTPVLGGLATVENEFDKPCLVEVVLRETFLERDAALLAYAKKRIPSLPLARADVLLINRMGKEISGAGMDPNITGRSPTPFKTSSFSATKAGVLRLTPASKGNAVGVGSVDVIPMSLRDAIDFDYTYANVITTTMLRSAFIPAVMPTDKYVLQCLIKTCNAAGSGLRLVYIRDTLTLDRFWVSTPLAEEIRNIPDCAVGATPSAFVFDGAGSLVAPEW